MASASPALFSLACPTCGGRLELTAHADLFKCAYCSHLAVLRWPSASENPTATTLIEKHKWAANLLRPGSTLNWQGGELILTDHELAFVPHAFNVGPLERAVLALSAIVSHNMDTGLLSDEIRFEDRDGLRWGLRVRKGPAVLAAIDEARRAATASR